MSKKDAPALSAWAPRMNIGCDSFTDVCWHRQLRPAPAFTPNGQQAMVPIDVIQIQSYDFAGPQTQSSQHQQNGVIPFSIRSFTLALA